MEAEENRTKVVVGILSLACLLLVWTLAMAGNLEPSGPPASTMKTLDEVESRTPIHASDLPLTITKPGSYYLVEDINFTDPTTDAITIACDDVTIDLMGYTLKGPDTGTKNGIYMHGRSNIKILNGTIRDFGSSAIWECGPGGNTSHQITNIRVLSNGFGITLNGFGHLVKDCIATNNSNYGITVDYGCTVSGNTCYGNGLRGIFVGAGCTVTGNTCWGNDIGIWANVGCTIVGNTIVENTSQGIYAGTYCLIDQNTAYDNSSSNLSYGTGCQVGLNVAP
jgi:parallel beta-helix repeat protein